MGDIIEKLSGNVYIPFCISLFLLLIIFLFILIGIDVSRWNEK